MLVSENRKFLFIHIQKTGGTSLTRHFFEHIPDIAHVCRPHSPITEFQGDTKKYFTAAFVRNPCDRLVSWFTAIDRKRGVNRHINFMQRQVLERVDNFRDFILHCQDIQSASGWLPFTKNQLDYISIDGKVAVDFIGRFESFDSSVSTLAKKIDIPDSVPHINSSSHKHYREYYDDETRAIVAKRFARDLEYFGYEF